MYLPIEGRGGGVRHRWRRQRRGRHTVKDKDD
jgi:hypothetical protein